MTQVGLKHSTWLDFILWLLRLRRRVRVAGASMFPLLNAGDILLFNPYAYRRRPPQPGELVVAYHPHKAKLKIIKRVAFITPDGRYHVRGDNRAASTDSDTFGPIPSKLILGQITSRFP